MTFSLRFVWMAVLAGLLVACSQSPVNNPYPADEAGRAYLYASFSSRPKHLDPARSYEESEQTVIGQIYEPPLQYDYLKRPYTLEPLAATEVPQGTCYDRQGRQLATDAPAKETARCVYVIHIRPHMYYQPHPALARDATGHYRYLHLKEADLAGIHSLADFRYTGTREVTADDFVYEVKRLADPRLNSPILGIMSEHILGLGQLASTLMGELKAHPHQSIDLRHYDLPGAEVVDRYTWKVTLQDKYPQFAYWLAMTFFAPVPWEADAFYNQPGLIHRNITLDWYPIGAGPYMLTRIDPNQRIQLDRNPNFHGETYPTQGMPGDRRAGLLQDAGRPLPLNDGMVLSLEKESIPYWNKFLQGYYDTSGVSSDSFDQAIRVTEGSGVELAPALQKKGIHLSTQVAASTFYTGFNMKDPVVGGNSQRARLLRQAISIAIDEEEFIAIFANGRGLAAQGPLPPGIFGYEPGQAGINPVVYDWVNNQPRRKPIDVARALMRQAGYPDGRDATTGQPLILSFDTVAGGPEDKARLDWLRKQFAKLDIQLNIRATDYNRFQDKVNRGDTQIFQFGWNADYPDPENFLFLLYGPNGKAAHGGENVTNYDNPEFNRLFDAMKAMPDGPARQQVIDRMLKIVREDAPWVWGMHPKSFALRQAWVHNAKPNLMAHNTLKYIRIDVPAREAARRQWNRPVWWPLWLLGALVLVLLYPIWRVWRQGEEETVP